MKVGEKIRAWRKSQKLTQVAAAKAAKVPQSVWSEIEGDVSRRISLEVAQRVVDVTGGVVVLTDFLPARRKKVRPILPAPDSTTNITDADALDRAG